MRLLPVIARSVSDEAIQGPGRTVRAGLLDCFAALAMTGSLLRWSQPTIEASFSARLQKSLTPPSPVLSRPGTAARSFWV